MSQHNSKEESIVSLQRLLSYHRRSTVYSFSDHNGSHTFSQEKIPNKSENSLPEDTMRNLWAFFDSSYFKDITQNELNILNCINHSEISVNTTHSHDEEFQGALEELFTPQYLRMDIDGGKQEELQRIWKQEMQINWNFIMEDSQSSQQAYRQFQQQREAIRGGTFFEMAKKEQELFESFKNHTQNASKHPLERELIDVLMNNSKIVDKILSKIYEETNDKNDCLKEKNSVLANAEIDELSPTVDSANRQLERQILLSYFKYEISSLQKKQIAECISKVKGKKMTASGNVYELIFEKAMRMQSMEVSESELGELNKLRQTSLFQFYQAGWKGRFNYICHNYLGFSILFTRPKEQTHLLTSASLMHYVAQSQTKSLSNEADKEFIQLETCHECRLLYNKNILSECTNISSNKQDLNFPAFYDPYIYFLLKNDSKAGELCAELWQNSLLSNSYYSGGAHECKRYYCKMCIKGESNVKCRFCQGICTCSRCIRNITIIRLKTIYALLGGDIALLEKQSAFSKVFPREVRKREGRERNDEERKQVKEMTMASYKMQLQEIRLMAHMVMRREIIKQELFLNEEAILMEKISALDRQ